MTDLEQLLGTRLHRLAEELSPDADPLAQVTIARSRYRRQRRNRVGLAAVAAATAVVLGVPVAIGSVSSAPGAGEVAGPRTGTSQPAPSSSADPRDLEVALAQARLAELTAARAAADEAMQQLAVRAQLGDLAARLSTSVVLPAPGRSTSAECPPYGAKELSAALGVPLQYWQGERVTDPAPCVWGVGEQLRAPIPDRLALQATFVPDTTSAEVGAAIAADDLSAQCPSAAAPAVAPTVVVRGCMVGDQVEWYLEVPDTDGTGLWTLSATVGDRYTDVDGPAALVALAELAVAAWGTVGT